MAILAIKEGENFSILDVLEVGNKQKWSLKESYPLTLLLFLIFLHMGDKEIDNPMFLLSDVKGLNSLINVEKYKVQQFLFNFFFFPFLSLQLLKGR